MMAMNNPLDAAYDLLRRVPPKNIEERMFDVLSLNVDLADSILSAIDIPFKVAICPETGKQFIQCDYNRDMNSYRSPFSSKFVPDLPDGMQPPARLRELEILANKGFQAYRHLIYDNEGILSSYVWDLGHDSFGIGVFIKKEISKELSDGSPIKGSINSSDIITVTPINEGAFRYDMTSSALISIELQVPKADPIVLSGVVSNKSEKTATPSDNVEHLVIAGQMIEENSGGFYEKIKEIYISKMKEIFSYTRCHLGDRGAKPIEDIVAKGMKERQ